MVEVAAPGFRLYSTTSNRRSLDPTDVSSALNMVWSGNRLETRDGSSLFKDDTQANWGQVARIRDFRKLGDDFFYVVAILTNGRIFYIRSDDANYGLPTATWTELNSSTGTKPALSANAYRYSLYGFNNKLFFADSTNGYFSWDGIAANLTAETDPTGLGSSNIVDLKDKSARLVALDDGGRTHLSAINDGSTMTGTGTGNLNYGRTEGLRATSMCPFNDDLIISTEDNLTLKYQTYRLLGIQFFDPLIPNTDTNQFEVRKVNTIAGIIGESGQEIADDTVGLTLRGVISLNKAINSDDLTERDFISFPIKELIQQINFNAASKIYSCVDYINGRYMLAVPFGPDSQEANIILVYDFIRSSPSENIYRWTVWNFYFGDIGSLGVIEGVPVVSDLNGNIYALNDGSANSADNGNVINFQIRLAPLGGTAIGTDKNFGPLTLQITNLSADFDLTYSKNIDNKFVIAEDNISFIHVDQLISGLLYDSPGIFYDDFNFYDSGTDQRDITLGCDDRGSSLEWSFSTGAVGVTWGIAGYSCQVEEIGARSAEALNNSQF